MITGIDHVQLAMPKGQEDGARAFYGALLGLTEVEKPQPLASRGGCWFEGPATVVHLGTQPDFAPARKAHPAFYVNDIGQARSRLEQGGAKITDDDALPEVPRFYIDDPFGNRIELIQRGAGFAERSPIATEAARSVR
jgi:catechol 2,3-dioxygenase-like lactoylglutathione lyase family enzyme